MTEISGLWLSIGICIGGFVLIAVVEWLLLRQGNEPRRDDGTADRSDEP